MISCNDGRCTLSGPLTIKNAASVLQEGAALFNGDAVILDLSAVSDVDSAAVSLLLEWQREAQRRGKRIQFVNLPANLQSLAKLYGVTELLGIAP
jgi:phospholipid transport system transporter-binding protein